MEAATANVDQQKATPKGEKDENKLDQQLDQIEPKSAARIQILGLEKEEREYVQRPLSYFGKLEMFGVLGTAIDRALTEGLRFTDVIGTIPGMSSGGGVTVEGFMQAVGKLASYAPDLLLDLYTIWLGVPREERWEARRLMTLPESEGGLSDDDGIEIIETFLDQNAEVLKDFFNQRLKPLIERAKSRFGLEEQQSLKPSSPTRGRTKKASKTS